MVGPRPEDEHRSAYRRFKAILVVLVGVSAGLIALEGDASLPVVTAAAVAGSVIGVALVWYVFPDRDEHRWRGRR